MRVFIRESGLEALLVRPAHLVAPMPGRRYRVIQGPGRLFERCATSEVARFMVEHLSPSGMRRGAVSLGSERDHPPAARS